MSDLDEIKEKYLQRADSLIKKYGLIYIIYLRVSTKDKQEELDQLPMILETFDLEKKKCLIIRARESAFQLKKDNSRVFNIIKEIITKEKYIDNEKFLYVWHLNRIYRNREKLVDFGLEMKKNKAMILSVRQKILSDCFKYPKPMNEIIYYLMLQLYGQSAQEESENKSNDLKKSLTRENGRTFTNKGNLFGRKLKTLNGKKITDPEKVDKIEAAIVKRINQGMPYKQIQKLLREKLKISVSAGQITNIKKKHL